MVGTRTSSKKVFLPCFAWSSSLLSIASRFHWMKPTQAVCALVHPGRPTMWNGRGLSCLTVTTGQRPRSTRTKRHCRTVSSAPQQHPHLQNPNHYGIYIGTHICCFSGASHGGAMTSDMQPVVRNPRIIACQRVRVDPFDIWFSATGINTKPPVPLFTANNIHAEKDTTGGYFFHASHELHPDIPRTRDASIQSSLLGP